MNSCWLHPFSIYLHCLPSRGWRGIWAQSEKPVENILIFAKECVPLHP